MGPGAPRAHRSAQTQTPAVPRVRLPFRFAESKNFGAGEVLKVLTKHIHLTNGETEAWQRICLAPDPITGPLHTGCEDFNTSSGPLHSKRGVSKLQSVLYLSSVNKLVIKITN